MLMEALELSAPGLENLAVVERPRPEPGHGEVLVRMLAASLNYRDLRMMQAGSGGRGGGLPITPLSDGCGVIEAVGPGVTRVAVGDRVASLFFQGWLDGPPTAPKLQTALGQPIPGVGRQYALLSEQGVSKVPDWLSDEAVACLPCAALTAWRAMIEDADLKPGSTVLLLGTGGVSVFALQFAKAAGYEIIITSSSDEKLERCRGMGAHHTLNYRATPEWGREARRITGRVGVDLVLEVGGPGTIQQSMIAVRVGGDIAMIGMVGGEGAGLQTTGLIGNGARVRGVNVGSRAMFEDMCKAMDLHRIEPVIDRVFPWRQAREAFDLMESGGHFGKIVLDFTA